MQSAWLQGQSCPGLTAGTIIALAGSVCNANSDTSCHYGGGHLPQITRYLALQTVRVQVSYPPPPLHAGKYKHRPKTGKNVKVWYETEDVIVITYKKLSNWKLSMWSEAGQSSIPISWCHFKTPKGFLLSTSCQIQFYLVYVILLFTDSITYSYVLFRKCEMWWKDYA